ncbi:MAG: shikimate dehydrogenase [Alphaproteobacteria bacterium]|nr:shikimate dehydrogenase [Alphaproteobacteria bacterium]
MTITGQALIAGVIGHPIAHSLSPCIHNYWLEQYHISGAYIPIEAKPEHLEQVVKGFAHMSNMRGMNVTIPHKESVMLFAHEIDSLAKRIGAANTLVFDNGKIRATNTDAYGFMAHLQSSVSTQPWVGNKAVVIGAGGAARAICVALQDAGVADIVLVNRTLANAEKIQMDLGEPITVAPWEQRHDLLSGAGLLVNTSSLGMQGKDPLDIDIGALSATAIVYDIVYKPLETNLLKQARLRGNPVVDGLGMLLHQAVGGFERWFGVKPEVTPQLRHNILQAAGLI